MRIIHYLASRRVWNLVVKVECVSYTIENFHCRECEQLPNTASCSSARSGLALIIERNPVALRRPYEVPELQATNSPSSFLPGFALEIRVKRMGTTSVEIASDREDFSRNSAENEQLRSNIVNGEMKVGVRYSSRLKGR